MPLDLKEDGENFVLEKIESDGTTSRLVLSEADLMTLAQSSPSFAQRVLERHKIPDALGVSSVIVTEVQKIGLHEDATGENILLSLYARSGAHQTYALSDELVEHLSKRLPVRLAEMREKRPKKH